MMSGASHWLQGWRLPALLSLACAALIAAAVILRKPGAAPTGIAAVGAASETAVLVRPGAEAVHMPKPTQRLIGITTAVAAFGDHAAAIELYGRVIADPDASARVQAVAEGVVEPAERGFPHVGRLVGKGEHLATLVPQLAPYEEAQLRQKLVELEREIALLLPRAEHAAQVNPAMPMGDTAVQLMQELQIQAQAMVRQAEIVKSALKQRIEIKSPIDGVIAAVNFSPGQMVPARETLLEIVVPGRLWVEAMGFAGALPETLAAASATAGGGRPVRLEPIGRGPALVQQAVPLLFRVAEEGSGIAIGTPVRVHAEGGERIPGIKVPRSAIVRRQGDAWVVWEHTDPEHFLPRRVRFTPVGVESAVVSGEVAAGMRLVVGGAQLIEQLR